MPLSVAEFDYIRKLVYDRTGVFLSEDKSYLVESRLSALAKETGASSVSGLVAQLQQKPFSPLHQPIIEAMMTNETFFFRDVQPFEILKTSILPELLNKRREDRTLKIWCAACSSGQEPYSIAMLLREHFPEFGNWKVHLLATDISTAMLDRATAGIYAKQEVSRGLPAEFLHKYFQHCGHKWQIKKELRQSIEFRQINLTESFGLMYQIDIIFMRNVLIYFDIPTKQSIFAKVRRVLRPDGYLFLGGGETTVNLDSAFELVQFDKGVCYKLK